MTWHFPTSILKPHTLHPSRPSHPSPVGPGVVATACTMSFIKKRLSSLLPSEARASLQNVLTVDWGDHKTVLVEVPQSNPNVEMEMHGMDPRVDLGDYGRLHDEDDENDTRRRKRRSFVNPRPSHIGIRVNPTRSVSQPLPQTRPPPRRQSTNPFEGRRLDELDEDLVHAKHVGTGAFKRDPPSPYDGLAALDTRQHTFDNPWESPLWNKDLDAIANDGKGVRNSAGTTSSTNSNPFRQSGPLTPAK